MANTRIPIITDLNVKGENTMKKQKLTHKAAKEIAIKELGTAKGLLANENNCKEFQIYEMRLGCLSVTIKTTEDCVGYAYVLYGGNYKYYCLETLEEDFAMSETESRIRHTELIKDMASCNRGTVIKALIDLYGPEECHRLINQAG